MAGGSRMAEDSRGQQGTAENSEKRQKTAADSRRHWQQGTVGNSP